MTPKRLGPYRIEKLLGSGGMGSVYAGVNDDTGGRAAIKVLNPQIAADANFRARFEGEIETLKKLRHPHIVQLYGFGEYEGQLFYSMELVDGCSLQDKLKAEGPLPWRDAVAIGIDVAMALKHAHDRGIIHRDLKPANLLIDSEGTVKLTDFGIAKLFGGNSFTAAGGVMGTADYMAPEQAQGVVVNHRVDLYSLGGVLYALLTGRPPFLGNSLVEVLDMLKHDTPTPVSRLMPKIPRAIDQIVLHLLEKNPQKRIPTALAAANQLRSLSHALSGDRTVVDHEGELRISESLTEVTPPSDDSAKIASKETAFLPPPGKTSDSATGGPAKPAAGGSQDEDTSLGRFQAQYFDSDNEADALTAQQLDDASATANRFTTVSADELGADDRSQFDFEDAASGWSRLAVIAIGIVLLALLGWYTLRKPSAETLWAEIEAIAASDDPQQFYDAEPQITQFLTLFPDDPHAEQARQYREEIELMRLQRKFERQLRRTADQQSLGAVEQLYLDAVANLATDSRRAEVQLKGLIALYESDAKADAETRQIVDLARRQLERVQAANLEAQREHLALLDERMKFAASIARSNASAAAEIYRAVIALYAEKPWAEKFVAAAREALADLQQSKAEAPPPEENAD